MPTNKISISFSHHHIDIYDYLKSKENISNYICQLVRADMNRKDTLNPELEIKIEELIKKILKENDYSFDNNFQSSTSQNIINSLTDDDKSLINNFF
jgi:hypothetical protein